MCQPGPRQGEIEACLKTVKEASAKAVGVENLAKLLGRYSKDALGVQGCIKRPSKIS
jgi:hypothetical protein